MVPALSNSAPFSNTKPLPALIFLLIAALSLPLLGACSNDTEQTGADAGNSRYVEGKPTRLGIGKVYMGRQIAYVMSHEGAGWLERGSREYEERTDLLINNLPIEPDDTVVDMGAGSGYFSRRMALMVPDGEVLAVDIQQEMLDKLMTYANAVDLNNIRPVLATETDPNLPANAVDLVLLVDAYHEFSYPYEVMSAIYNSLKTGGKVVLIEYRAEDPDVPIHPAHKMTQEQSIKEMEAVGLQWVETLDILPRQHFMVFERPAEVAP